MDGPLNGTWMLMRQQLLATGKRSDREIEQFRIMYFYGARNATLLLLSPLNPSATVAHLVSELLAFDKEMTSDEPAPAATRAAEPDGQDQAPAA